MIVAFVGIFIAIALGVVALLRPAAQAAAPAEVAPQYSEQQVADAKKTVCEAHDLVNRATTYAGTQKSDDPALQLGIAVNVRLTGALSAQYFQTKLAQYPATPPDLVAATNRLILANQEIALLQISNASREEFDPSYQAFDAAQTKASDACK